MMTRRKNYPTEQKTMRSAAMLLAGISLFMTFFIALWSWNNPASFIRYIGIDPSALKIPEAWILAAAAAVGYRRCAGICSDSTARSSGLPYMRPSRAASWRKRFSDGC